MSSAEIAGMQLYAMLAEILAPDVLADVPAVLLQEPSGKIIDPEDYQDSLMADEIFSELVNPIPILGINENQVSIFIDSSRLYDNVYKLIVESAEPISNPNNPEDPVNVNAAHQIEQALFDLTHIVRASIDNPADLYNPSKADPVRWWDLTTSYSEVSFVIGKSETPPQRLPTWLGDMRAPSWAWRKIPSGYLKELDSLVRSQGNVSLTNARSLGPKPGIVDRMRPFTGTSIETTLETNTPIRANKRRIDLSTFEVFEKNPKKLKYRTLIDIIRFLDRESITIDTQPTDSGFTINFQYCVVSIKRPWLHSELFSVPGWSMPGYSTNDISNGQSINNNGLLPVITTRFLVVRNLVVHAEWSEADLREQKCSIAIGPFKFTNFDGGDLYCKNPQIVAWLASIVPACPII